MLMLHHRSRPHCLATGSSRAGGRATGATTRDGGSNKNTLVLEDGLQEAPIVIGEINVGGEDSTGLERPALLVLVVLQSRK